MLGLFLNGFFSNWDILPVSLTKQVEAAVKRSLLLPFCPSCPPPLLHQCCCRPAAVCGCERWTWMSAEAPCQGSCGSVGRRAAAELAAYGGGREKSFNMAGCILAKTRSRQKPRSELQLQSFLLLPLMIVIEQRPPPPLHLVVSVFIHTRYKHIGYLCIHSYFLSVLRHHVVQSISRFFLTGVHQTGSI